MGKIFGKSTPKPAKPRWPGDDSPVSHDEKQGVDAGPCNSFSPSEKPWQHRCANCGYGHS